MPRILRTFILLAGLYHCLNAAPRRLLAGAAEVDVSPPDLPVIVNCFMTERSVDKVRSPLFAKAVVLDNGVTRIALVIVDSCMMPRELVDKARDLVPASAGVARTNMLIAATHTHFAPAAMPCLGSDEQAGYASFLAAKIAEAVSAAASRLEPARIGWSSVDDPEHTFNRRWIYERGKELTDPFGVKSVRANMHPGYQNPNAIGPAGPVDSEISVLAVQSAAGRPIALLANYGMHYFNDQPVSSDYFGVFVKKLAGRIGAPQGFVGIMSQGTSGDLAPLDYSRAKANDWTLEAYADGVAASAERAYRAIRYVDWVPLGTAESLVKFKRRLAGEDRLAWAREMVASMAGRKPKNQPEVYAREQLLIAAEPERELRLQAVRIGELGIAAIPNEVYALTGLKIKARSPFSRTFNIELANGADGYIPPPEQHLLGGYTTWAARTAGLAVDSETRITDGILTLLEKLAGKPRRPARAAKIAERQATLARKPVAYWPLDDMDGEQAMNLIGPGGTVATFQGGVARYLEGKLGRAAHFAGGIVNASVNLLSDYTIEFWAWHGLLPAAGTDSRSTIVDAQGIRLEINRDGRLFLNGAEARGAMLPARTWTRLALVRKGELMRLLVEDAVQLEQPARAGAVKSIRFAGDGNPDHGFEGKLDEIAVFSKAIR